MKAVRSLTLQMDYKNYTLTKLMLIIKEYH